MSTYLKPNKTTYKVTDFISWAKNGELSLSPSFQRRPVWRAPAKSYFIDTVVRGLPIPIVFLREITDIKTLKTVREVVDGQQRLRTLLSFIDPSAVKDFNPDQDSFVVKKVHNGEIAGKRFQDLPERVQALILGYEISSHVLPPDTSDRQVLDMFRRMNATGTKLNEQELRNAEFFGEFIQSVYETSLQYLDTWRAWRIFSEYEIARMIEAEFLSELYMFVLSGVLEKTQKSIDDAYDRYDIHFAERSAVEKRVSVVLDAIDRAFEGELAATNYKNRILFYALFAAVYGAIYGIGSALAESAKGSLSADAIRGLKAASAALGQRDALPKEVSDALLSRSNRKSNREHLVRFIQQHMTA